MIRLVSRVAPLGLVSVLLSQSSGAPATCADGWMPQQGRRIEVNHIDALEAATRGAWPGDNILLADGDYPLRTSLDIAAPNVTIRGRRGDPTKVSLRGHGMAADTVGVAISVSAPGVTVADLTVRDVKYHAIQVRGERGASGFTLYNARLLDTGQQLLKVSVSEGRRYADDGLVACSDFSYTTTAPSDYTNGVDLLATRGWVIRDNRFQRIRGPESRRWQSGPAILAWMASEDTIVERNVIIDSFRGIALGLTPGPNPMSRNGHQEYDHLRGIVRNNVILNLNRWADEAIEANAAREARIEHNTVLVESVESPWSIGIRFPAGSALVRNNLTNHPILQRNGGHFEGAGNVTAAKSSWFVEAPGGNLRLSAGGASAVDVGVMITDVMDDFDRAPRVQGRGPDAGAFESRVLPSLRQRSRD